MESQFKGATPGRFSLTPMEGPSYLSKWSAQTKHGRSWRKRSHGSGKKYGEDGENMMKTSCMKFSKN